MANRLTSHASNTFDATRYAFLEMVEPSIAQVIDDCVSNDAFNITVLPYFLSQGNHVARDIPAIIDVKRREYPQISFNLLPHFGQSNEMVDWLLAHVNGNCV